MRWLRLLVFLLVGVFALGCALVTTQTPPLLPTLQATAVPPPTSTIAPAPATATPPPTAVSPTAIPPTNTPPPTETAVPTSASPPPTASFTTQIIGYSVQARPLTDYQFGRGPDQIVLVGGIHGGYEWNTILLAYQAIDYFNTHSEAVPRSVTLHIIPAANPDGQFLVTGRDGRFSWLDVAANSFPGRFNGNNVDLNRNWDCNWVETAVWRDQPIYGGPAPFSEPESQALRDFLVGLNPAAVIFWHSAANGVYAASCPDLYWPSYTLATLYGQAAGYPVYESFTSYEVTGDAGDWLALQGIPSISVELINHESMDWPQNLGGITAVLAQYRQIQ